MSQLPRDCPAIKLVLGELDPETLDREELYSAYCDLCAAADYVNDLVGNRDAQ